MSNRKFSARYLALPALLGLGVLCSRTVPAATSPMGEQWRAPTKIAGVQFEEDKVEIKTEGVQAKYKTFAIASPPKVVLEFYDTWIPSGFPESLKPSPAGAFVDRVRVAQFSNSPQHVARVVVDLAQAAPYQATQLNGTVTLDFKATAKKTAMAATGVGAAPKALQAKTAASAQGSSDNLDRDLLRELPTAPIDVDFRDLDIGAALTILIEKLESLLGNKLNLIMAPDVTGTITLQLEQVPYNEVFQTILTIKQLAASQTGSNIIKIMGQTSYLAEKQRAITNTRIFILNYVAAAEMSTHLNAIRSMEGRKGSILIANDINALIVTDTDDGLIQTANLIKQLDIRPKAVQIEAKIIDLQIDKATDYGIEWQYAKDWDRSNLTGAEPQLDRRSIGYTNPNATTKAGGIAGAMPSNPVRLSLPPGGTAVTSLAFTFGRVTNTSFLTSALSFAAREGRLKVLSNPKIVTLNNKAASITAGSQVPTVVTTVSPGVGTTQSASYLSVGVLLNVTPTITSDRYIKMVISPTVSQVGSTGGVPGVAPAINTRTASTTLIVKDEETAVIGGLISETKDRQTTKVPILGDLPLIGWFFRRTSRNDPRSELLVFVTPKILD
ncbi:MAG: AMIN domain-containing protein [Elusimicrobia bacterium]|nr:AMIN domain-containing protein [Elusimicrobiota bacterium]